jgi:dihydroneopterin aldolase
MTDKIVIEGLRIFGHHGVGNEEREAGQDFLVDLTISADLAEAGASDDLGDTVDYSTIVKEVQRIVSTERYRLIERLAERIVDAVFEHPRALTVIVRVAKADPPIDAEVGSVGVEIERWRK